MTRMSASAALALIVTIAASSVSRAQPHAGSPPPGTNSAGTAQSSGQAPNRRSAGVTTGSSGLGSGRAAGARATSADAAVKAENELLNRKLKGICRGC